MSEEELLPCPFCGEEAVHDIGISPLESVDWAWCNNQECPLHGELLFTVEQWNTRPDSKPYKWKNPDEWVRSVMGHSEKPVTFLTAFNAGRERKEG